jgi:3-oxoacyl-[acyl-carrier-protein] synthase II
MKICINGTGNVSPQKTWDPDSFIDDVQLYHERMIQCPEPEVDTGLDEKYLRRMSRLMRLGWIASKLCLDDAGNPDPDAIITGSGRGSVMDSEKFLLSIYRNKENLLPPTPFIQSTHNALGAQIAMLLNNSAYNMAYAHCSHAFEHAMLDAVISLKNGERQNILLGGFDEITTNQFILIDRLDRWRKHAVNNLELFNDILPGTISGEGFTFFFLQNHITDNTYALVKDVETLFSVENAESIAGKAISFLNRNGLGPGMTDWVFTGRNGDQANDQVYADVLSGVFKSGYNEAAWKHLTGEYFTSTAFATWAAAKSIRLNSVPRILQIKSTGNQRNVSNILIYNHFKGIHHSFILLSKPD